MELSNVIGVQLDLRVQRGGDFEFEITAGDAEGNPIDWALVPKVRIDVVNPAGIVFTSFSYGDGLFIDTGNSEILRFIKAANEKNIAKGTYEWQLKVEFSLVNVKRPVWGRYFSVDYITA